MEYIKIIFTHGLDCEAYQEINNGSVERITDMDGNTLVMPAITESHVIDENPLKPDWGT